jgi:putative intracellular protease/amidase
LAASTLHLYVFDGFADWEPAFVTAAVHNPQFQREPGRWQVRTVAARPGLVRSMGGLAVLPDTMLRDLAPRADDGLLLPGGPGWEDPACHHGAIAAARAFAEAGVPVAAICGATAGLARAGLLDTRPHTSNAAAYLRGTGYAGVDHYREQAAVDADGVITAGGMAPLEFARCLLARLGVYEPAALEAWYQLYHTGKSAYFARLRREAEAAP